MTKRPVIDLHMHSTVSDGTDTPLEILEKIKEKGIEIFSITDHDAIKAADMMKEYIKGESVKFISGVEFSSRDEHGRYHILGYGYDPEGKTINDMVEYSHELRMQKVHARLDFLRDEFGFTFEQKDIDKLLARDNPGKPHIGKMMVAYGYAQTKEEAIEQYLNKKKFKSGYVDPRDVIDAILGSGGIPVLAHPTYGNGDQLIVGDEMDGRIRRLMSYGLKGLEGFYSGFTLKIQKEILGFAKQYGLYVTAGSDYHGKNKMVILGDNNLDPEEEYPEGLVKFLEEVRYF